jgi:Fic family protein
LAHQCIFAANILLIGSNMIYNWQDKEWANFRYNSEAISGIVPVFTEMTGAMDCVLNGLTVAEQQEELIGFMISEAMTTSEIEGELLSGEDLMSSIRNRLGLNAAPATVKDARAVAVSNMLVAVRNSYARKLTVADIKQWHGMLFDGSKTITAGKWRTGTEPMQIISGAFGRETVHYEAPPSYRVPAEMNEFVRWYNAFDAGNDPAQALIKTAVAHLYFESIHPFEDGNGRIGRAIAEKCLAQSLEKPVLLSLSSVIEKDRKQYYAALKRAQCSMEITDWTVYFARVIAQAQLEAIEIVKFSMQKTNFFGKYQNQLNERELKAVRKMFDAGVTGFEGGMTAKKYMNINQTSKATATRELRHLSETGVLLVQGGGRNVHYQLNLIK